MPDRVSSFVASPPQAPTVQDAVIAYIDQLGTSFTLRDLYVPLGLPRTAVNRVLDRLHRKGFVTRVKVMAPRRGYHCDHATFLYSLAEEYQ